MPETPNGLRTICWDLPFDLSMVGRTRGMMRDTLVAWALSHLADDVILAASELVANAITYGEPPIRLSLWASAEDLCIRVTDHGAGLPRHLDLGLDSVHGRGLTIVAALADDHGITPLTEGPGKTVWIRWRHTTRRISTDECDRHQQNPTPPADPYKSRDQHGPVRRGTSPLALPGHRLESDIGDAAG